MDNTPTPLSACPAQPTIPAYCPYTSPKTYVVVGAGAAGLAAARTLSDGDPLATVKVIEARARNGGRIWTGRDVALQKGFSVRGGEIDLGASWIHGPTRENPVTVLRDAAGINTTNANFASVFAALNDGTVATGTDAWDNSWSLYSATKKAYKALLAAMPLSQDKSLYDIIASTRSPSPLTDPYYLFWLNTGDEFNRGADVSTTSARMGDDDSQFGTNPDLDVLFPDGYDQITNYLINTPNRRALDITLSSPVTAIITTDAPPGCSAGQVRVEHGGSYTCADNVVVTLPLGVLKKASVAFNPPLSDAKLGAISRMGAGITNKVYLKFDTQFWPSNKTFFALIPDAAKPEERGLCRYFLNTASISGAPTMLAFGLGMVI
jgi:polyamine oxidase